MKTKEEIIKFLKEPKLEDFKVIAEELLHHFVIKKQEQKLNEDIKEVCYNLAEIEFYYYGKGHKDRHTYIRMANAGSWFFHGSGVDLAFQTIEDKTIEDKEKRTLISFGGILIRSIIRTEDNKTISGPIRCMEELINNNAGVLEWDMVENSSNKNKEIANPIKRTGLQPFKMLTEGEKDYSEGQYKYYLKDSPWQKCIERYKYYLRQKDKKRYLTIEMSKDNIDYQV